MTIRRFQGMQDLPDYLRYRAIDGATWRGRPRAPPPGGDRRDYTALFDSLHYVCDLSLLFEADAARCAVRFCPQPGALPQMKRAAYEAFIAEYGSVKFIAFPTWRMNLQHRLAEYATEFPVLESHYWDEGAEPWRIRDREWTMWASSHFTLQPTATPLQLIDSVQRGHVLTEHRLSIDYH